jgi:hypothetical protein
MLTIHKRNSPFKNLKNFRLVTAKILAADAMEPV